MKKMAMVVLMVMATVFFSIPAMAQEESEQIFSFGLEAGAYTKYIDELSGYRTHNGSIAFILGIVSHSSGFYAAAEGYKNFGGDDYDEVNLYAARGWSAWGMEWDAGYAFYEKYELHGFYASAQFTDWEFFGFIPFADVEVDIPNSSEVEGGVLYRIGLITSVPLMEQEIDLKISIAGHDGAWGTRSELVSSAKITASTTIILVEEVAEIIPEMNYQKSLGYAPAGEDDEEAGGMTDDEFWAGVKVVFYF